MEHFQLINVNGGYVRIVLNATQQKTVKNVFSFISFCAYINTGAPVPERRAALRGKGAAAHLDGAPRQ
jgi:hypothetical protein